MKMSKRIFLKNLSLLSVGQAFIPLSQAENAFQPARREEVKHIVMPCWWIYVVVSVVNLVL